MSAERTGTEVYQNVTQDEGDESLVIEARSMGWKPKDEFRGDQSKWIEAKDYVEFGRKALPILQQNNQRLHGSVSALEARVNQLTAALEASKNDFQVMQEVQNEELTRRVQEERQNLLTRLKAAKRDDDTDLEVELTDQLTRLNTAQAEAETPAKGPTRDEQEAQAAQIPLNPAMRDWVQANEWFGKDPQKTARAVGIGHLVRADHPDLMGAEFYQEVDRRLAKLNVAPARGDGKVAPSSGGSGSGGGGDAGRTYADLPAEAKKACDRYAEKFVNPNGQFKTTADYRKHYVRQLEQTGYFQQGQ